MSDVASRDEPLLKNADLHPHELNANPLAPDAKPLGLPLRHSAAFVAECLREDFCRERPPSRKRASTSRWSAALACMASSSSLRSILASRAIVLP